MLAADAPTGTASMMIAVMRIVMLVWKIFMGVHFSFRCMDVRSQERADG